MQYFVQILHSVSLAILVATIIYRLQVVKGERSPEKLPDATLLLWLSSILFLTSLLNGYILYRQNGQFEIILLPLLFLMVFSLSLWIFYCLYKFSRRGLSLQLVIPTVTLFLLYLLTALATLFHFENVFYVVLFLGILSIFISGLFLLKHKSFQAIPRIWKYALPFGILFILVSYEVISSAPPATSSESTAAPASTDNDTDADAEDETFSEEPVEEPVTEEVEETQEISDDVVNASEEEIYDQTKKYYASYTPIKIQDPNEKIELAPSFFYEINQIEVGEVNTYEPFVKKFMFNAEPTSVLKVSVTVQNNTSKDYYYSFASTFINNGTNEYSPVGKFTLNQSYDPNTELPLLRAGTKDRGSYYVFMEESADTLDSFDFLIGLPTDPATGNPVDSSSNNTITISLD